MLILILSCFIAFIIGSAFLIDGANRAQSYLDVDREYHVGTFWRTFLGTLVMTVSIMVLINIVTIEDTYIKALKGHNPYQQMVTRTYNAADSSLVSIDTTYTRKK